MKPEDNAAYKYWCFISYSHKNADWGRWLQRKLERYRVPKSFVGMETRIGKVPRRMFPVFRDDTELPIAANLGDNLREALEQSRYLIVVCSPHSACSHWVNEEVRIFKTMGRKDNILCLIVDGEPNASDKAESAAQECFPEAIRFAVDPQGARTEQRTEPIAADARRQSTTRRHAFLKLVAGILGIDYGMLYNRDRQQRLRKWITATLVATVVAALVTVLGVYAFQQREEAVRQAKEAEEQYRAAEAMKEARERKLYMESIATAQELLGQCDYDRATSILWKCPERFRQWEWGHLLLQACPQCADVGNNVNGASFFPGGDRVLTYSSEAASVWDTVTGRQLNTFKGAAPPMTFVLSPDGEKILAISYNGTGCVWSAHDGHTLFQISAHSVGVFSADSKKIAVPLYDNELAKLCLVAAVYDAETGATIATLQGHEARIMSLQFNPEGTRVLTYSFDGTARIWDSATGSCLATLLCSSDVREGICALFGPGSNTVLFSSDMATFPPGPGRLVNWETGATLASFPAAINTYAASPSLRYASTVTREDCFATLWNLETFCVEQSLKCPRLTNMTFSPDGAYVAINDTLWEPSTGGRLTLGPRGKGTFPTKVAFGPDGKQFVTWEDFGPARLWSLHPAIAKPDIHERRICERFSRFAFTPDGKRAVTERPITRLQVMDVFSETEGISIDTEENLQKILINADGGKVLALPEDPNSLPKVWDLETGKATTIIPSDSFNEGIFNDNGTLLISRTGPRDRHEVWDTATGAAVGSVAKGSVVLGFSPDARHVLATDDRFTYICDIRSGEVAASLEKHAGTVVRGAFSAGGNRVVLCEKDNNAVLWDWVSGENLVLDLGHGASAASAEFSHDDSFVLTTSADERLKTWDSQTGALLTTIEGVAGISHTALSRDDRQILLVDSARTLALFDATTGRKTGTLGAGPDSDGPFFSDAEFSADGETVAVMFSGIVKTYNVKSGALLREVSDARAMSHSRDGASRVVCCRNGQQVELRTGDSLARISVLETVPPGAMVGGLCFSPDGKHLVGLTDHRTLKIWDGEIGKSITAYASKPETLNPTHCFSPDSKCCIVGKGSALACIELETGKEVWSTPERIPAFWSNADLNDAQDYMRFSPDNGRIAATTHKGTISIIDAANGQDLATLGEEGNKPRSLAWSGNGKSLVSGMEDGTVRVYDLEEPLRYITLQAHTRRISCVCASFDAARVVTASPDGLVKVWNVASESVAHKWETGSHMVSIVMTPDERRIVAMAWNGALHVWDAEEGNLVLSLKSVSSDQTSAQLAVSPDGLSVYSDYDKGDPFQPFFLRSAPYRLEDLPGDSSMTWETRFALWKRQAR